MDLISTREAARLAHCHVHTVRRWLATGVLQGWRRRGRWFVSRRQVEALWSAHSLLETRSERTVKEMWARRVLEERGVKTR